MDQDEAEKDRELISRSGTFSIQLVSPRTRWNYREEGKLAAHDKVLRPLLKLATECWVYDLKSSSAVYRAAGDLLEPDRGRHRVSLAGDPVKGHERFWNAQAGKRGTIVIIVPRTKFDAERIFRGGYEAFVFVNFRAGHTPAAIRFARERVESSDVIACCLPRNNGIEWMDIYVNRKRALGLFDVAQRTIKQK